MGVRSQRFARVGLSSLVAIVALVGAYSAARRVFAADSHGCQGSAIYHNVDGTGMGPNAILVRYGCTKTTCATDCVPMGGPGGGATQGEFRCVCPGHETDLRDCYRRVRWTTNQAGTTTLQDMGCPPGCTSNPNLFCEPLHSNFADPDDPLHPEHTVPAAKWYCECGF